MGLTQAVVPAVPIQGHRNTPVDVHFSSHRTIDGRSLIYIFNLSQNRQLAEFLPSQVLGDVAVPRRFLLRKLCPGAKHLVGALRRGIWRSGDVVRVRVEARQVTILEVLPALERVNEPLLFNAVGDAWLDGRVLRLTGVKGEAGTESELLMLLPEDCMIDAMTINGQRARFSRFNRRVCAHVRFSGTAVARSHPILVPDAQFRGGTISTRFAIPASVSRQVGNPHAEASPPPLAHLALLPSDRVLLLLRVDQADSVGRPELWIDGEHYGLRPAYAFLADNHTPPQCVGYFADLSSLAPDVDHQLTLQLPPLLPGQFEGAFLPNTKAQLTDQWEDPQPRQENRVS